MAVVGLWHRCAMQKWILWFDSGRISKDGLGQDGPRGGVSSGGPLLMYWILGSWQLKSTSVTGPAGQPPIHNLVLSEAAEERWGLRLPGFGEVPSLHHSAPILWMAA